MNHNSQQQKDQRQQQKEEKEEDACSILDWLVSRMIFWFRRIDTPFLGVFAFCVCVTKHVPIDHDEQPTPSRECDFASYGKRDSNKISTRRRTPQGKFSYAPDADRQSNPRAPM